MNTSYRLARRQFTLQLIVSFLAAVTAFGADGQPGVANVRGILGQAQFSRAGGSWVPLGPGMVLRPGDIVQTTAGSAVDLHLGDIVGTVRLTGNAALSLDKLPAGNTPAAGFEVQLSLRAGELLGLSKAVPQGSRFEVKVASGIAQILEGRFRVDSRGLVVLVEGRALFAHVPSTGEPSAHTLAAPPSVYFAPDYGIQPAPKELVREVAKQMRSKLPRR